MTAPTAKVSLGTRKMRELRRSPLPTLLDAELVEDTEPLPSSGPPTGSRA
jgi:hypothetical protein